MDSLALKNEAPFREAAGVLLLRELMSVHENYIRERLVCYRRVLRRIRAEGLEGSCVQVTAAWNEGLFFEVHDLLEPVWLEEEGGRKMALKGLIKAAAAYVHLSLDRKKTGKNLAAKASSLIRRHREFLSDFENLDPLLEGLDRGDPVPPRL